MIVILGGLFLLVAVVALYFLVEKKVITNPFTYLFPSTPSTPSTSDSSDLSDLMDDITPSDDTATYTYTDKLSPDKPIKGRYIKIAQSAMGSGDYNTLWCHDFNCSENPNMYTRAYHNKPIKLTNISIYDKGGETMNIEALNITTTSDPPTTQDEIAKLYDAEDYDDDGNLKYTEFSTDQITSTLGMFDWLRQQQKDSITIDLKKNRTISEIILEARSSDDGTDYNMAGVYVEIQSASKKPIARTPVISLPGRVFGFKFPGTRWYIGEVPDLEFE